MPSLGARRRSWKSPVETGTRRGSKRSSRGAGTMRKTDSCRERLRRRDREEGGGGK